MFAYFVILFSYIVLMLHFKSMKEAFWSFEFYFVVFNIFVMWAFYDFMVWFQTRAELLMLGVLMENLNG